MKIFRSKCSHKHHYNSFISSFTLKGMNAGKNIALGPPCGTLYAVGYYCATVSNMRQVENMSGEDILSYTKKVKL